MSENYIGTDSLCSANELVKIPTFTQLEEEFITGRDLDKLGIALQHVASTTDDKKITSDIEWTMSHLDMVYTKFKESEGK